MKINSLENLNILCMKISIIIMVLVSMYVVPLYSHWFCSVQSVVHMIFTVLGLPNFPCLPLGIPQHDRQ